MSPSRPMTWDELAQENGRLKRQLAKAVEVLAGFDHVTACPDRYGLPSSNGNCDTVGCKECWQQAVEGVE